MNKLKNTLSFAGFYPSLFILRVFLLSVASSLIAVLLCSVIGSSQLSGSVRPILALFELVGIYFLGCLALSATLDRPTGGFFKRFLKGLLASEKKRD